MKYLSIIRQSLQLIQQEQTDFDIESIPLNHTRVYRILAEGKTKGIFSNGIFWNYKIYPSDETNSI